MAHESVENVAQHAGGRWRTWIGGCALMSLGALSGQIKVIPAESNSAAEVVSIDLGLLVLGWWHCVYI